MASCLHCRSLLQQLKNATASVAAPPITSGNVRRWQYFYLKCSSTKGSCWPTAGKDAVNKATKGEKAGGLYFPIAAVQVRAVLRLTALDMYL